MRSLILAAILLPSLTLADDWPQWRGPNRDGISKETGLLTEWPANGPALAWKATGLGEGYTTPSVAGGHVYGMGLTNGRDEVVWALDAATGKPVWTSRIGDGASLGGAQGGHGPRGTPTVEGSRLFVEGAGGTVACLERASGKVIWKKDLVSDFGGAVPRWGFSESPLVDRAKVILTPGGRGAALVALNLSNGETIWKAAVPGDDRAGYSSTIAADVDGKRQYIQFTARGVVAVAAEDGKFLWRFNKPANGTANCSTPIYRDHIVFAASAYNNGGGAARIESSPAGAAATELYFKSEMQNHHGGIILLGGALYGTNNRELLCLDFVTGEIKWQSPGVGKGSVTFADGCFYLRGERGGAVALILPSPTGPVEKGRFKQPDPTGKPAWAHPVVANGKLYLRDYDNLFCYDVKKK